jgi:hypothetical protein
LAAAGSPKTRWPAFAAIASMTLKTDAPQGSMLVIVADCLQDRVSTKSIRHFSVAPKHPGPDPPQSLCHRNKED